jgi:hypothetical protein
MLMPLAKCSVGLGESIPQCGCTLSSMQDYQPPSKGSLCVTVVTAPLWTTPVLLPTRKCQTSRQAGTDTHTLDLDTKVRIVHGLHAVLMSTRHMVEAACTSEACNC